ncbi:hypothetical protein ES703_101992 [subsurface metagenome]
MKLNVQGIEEIEITDPSGLCNPPVPQLPSQPRGIPGIPPNLPSGGNPFTPQPMVPTPISPFRPQPGVAIYTRKVGDPLEPHTKWGVGGPMIQQAGEQVDPEKWEKNWQASMGEKGKGDGDGSTH